MLNKFLRFGKISESIGCTLFGYSHIFFNEENRQEFMWAVKHRKSRVSIRNRLCRQVYLSKISII